MRARRYYPVKNYCARGSGAHFFFEKLFLPNESDLNDDGNLNERTKLAPSIATFDHYLGTHMQQDKAINRMKSKETLLWDNAQDGVYFFCS